MAMAYMIWVEMYGSGAGIGTFRGIQAKNMPKVMMITMCRRLKSTRQGLLQGIVELYAVVAGITFPVIVVQHAYTIIDHLFALGALALG